jgi:hypothetical protein
MEMDRIGRISCSKAALVLAILTIQVLFFAE